MKLRMIALGLVAGLTVTACALAAFAQDAHDTLPARPMDGHLTPHLRSDIKPPAVPLTTWNGNFNFQGTNYNFNMVGTNPANGGVTTTIPAFLIPVKMVYKSRRVTTTFDPLTHVLPNGKTVTQNTLASPIFNAGINFVSGGANVGNTQYIDAFQRANFWGNGGNNANYHLLLGSPTVLPELTLNVPSVDGRVATEFGVKVGLADINYFDAQLQAYMNAHPVIVPNSLPIFITYDTYLTQGGGCCIGGYHSSFGALAAPQAYAHFTYIDKVGAFAQDVSALSHEVGEWADDPLVVNVNGNPVACGILENGDPEEGFANFGGFVYALGGFNYNLQDLVNLPYFGDAAVVSAGGLTFQGNPFGLGICSNGG